jgi:hypothetical protein
MIDKKTMADLCPWVDLDAGQKTTDMGEQATEEFTPTNPQPMGDAVKKESVKTRVTENDLKEVSDSRIARKDNIKIFLQ